ncbi:capsule biosynthesis protein [Burkholderia cepacia]|uniref:capsule biosynthesis protein n=1 Tax=Burkholderia cepacia TaxID=292 RepID=UPI001588AB16|nr:capsular biosynthesis protein [Burkholderia cepacia]MCE4126279.1 capsular biosynthesis protein [Burkholderia cepacia]
MPRSFLVLQGPASPFFSRLADALFERRHSVRRVNFCGGDLLYGRAGEGWNYRDKLSDLPGWYTNVVQTGDFTDVIMFGDCREVHRHFHPVSEIAGLNVHVFEEGYVRPHWLTLERHGVNGRSRLPRDPAWYLDRRESTPRSQTGEATGYNLFDRAFHDIRYRAANAFYRPQFPYYRSHRPRNGGIEYAGLALRAISDRRFQREAEQVTRELLEAGRGYYIFPLQLNSDAQISVHSPFAGGICQAIDVVLESFAQHGPSDAQLVIKNHPLDTGLIDYRKHVVSKAGKLGIATRVRFIDAGHLPTLLEHSRGVVVVNSTVGLSALHHRKPLMALGVAIYDMRGLTWQGELDDFWQGGEPPNAILYQAFLDYVVNQTQINGDFYTDTGIAMAVEGVVRRLEADR